MQHTSLSDNNPLTAPPHVPKCALSAPVASADNESCCRYKLALQAQNLNHRKEKKKKREANAVEHVAETLTSYTPGDVCLACKHLKVIGN